MSSGNTLVTGAGGFIGRKLCERLAGQDVRVLGQVLPGEASPACHECIVADVRDRGQVEALCRDDVDRLYHLAGHASVPDSVADPVADFEVNVLGTFHMLELARRMKLRSFLFASTVSVLDPGNPLPLGESAVCGPSAPYPAAKLAGEAYCSAYSRSYNVPTRVVRMFNVYGPGAGKLVVHDLIVKLLRNPQRLELLGDGEQLRDFLYVDDAAAGLQLVAEAGADGEVYHLGTGRPTTIRQLVEVLIQQLGLSGCEVVAGAQTWTGDMPQWYADISKISALGFRPTVDLPAGVARTIEWIKRTGV